MRLDAHPAQGNVLHLIRTFLRKTETFVPSQIVSARRYRTWTLARNHRPGETELFPVPDLAIYTRDRPRSPLHAWADLSYRAVRRMTAVERRFYLDRVRRIRPDVVHVHYGPDACYFLPVLAACRAPALVSFYGFDASRFPNWMLGLGRRTLNRMFPRVQQVLAMSRDMRSDLIRIGCPADKVRIHYPNGVDLARFACRPRSPSPGEKTVLLNVAAMEARKGQEGLLAAFARVRQREPRAELRIAGDGPLKPRLEERIRSLGLQDRVRLLGHLPYERLPDELDRAHVYCHPSVTDRRGDKEGIPTVILEAAATGLPVVATRHAGIPEAVREGETGFLVAERDTEALARRILELVRDPGLRRRMGEAGRRHVETHFDVDRIAVARERIYDDLIAAFPRGNR